MPKRLPIRIVLTNCLVALCSILLNGQTMITALPVPNVGDTIIRYVDVTPSGVELTEPGQDQSWTWELNDTLMISLAVGENDMEDEFPDADIHLDNGVNKTYYVADSSKWAAAGIIGGDPLGLGVMVASIYEPPLAEVYAPVSFGDTVFNSSTVYTGIPRSIIPDSIWDQLPLAPDSMRAAISFQQNDIIDASGMLTINEMSYEVLRQYRESRYAVRIEAKISILPWTDVTDILLDFIGDLPIDIPLADTLYYHNFLAEGEGFPVAVLTIADDTTVSRVEYMGETINAAVIRIPFVPAVYAYPNPAFDQITIPLDLQAGGELRVEIYDQYGRILDQQRVASGPQIELSLQQQPPGLMIIRILDDQANPIGIAKVIKR